MTTIIEIGFRISLSNATRIAAETGFDIADVLRYALDSEINRRGGVAVLTEVASTVMQTPNATMRFHFCFDELSVDKHMDLWLN